MHKGSHISFYGNTLVYILNSICSSMTYLILICAYKHQLSLIIKKFKYPWNYYSRKGELHFSVIQQSSVRLSIDVFILKLKPISKTDQWPWQCVMPMDCFHSNTCLLLHVHLIKCCETLYKQIIIPRSQNIEDYFGSSVTTSNPWPTNTLVFLQEAFVRI